MCTLFTSEHSQLILKTIGLWCYEWIGMGWITVLTNNNKPYERPRGIMSMPCPPAFAQPMPMSMSCLDVAAAGLWIWSRSSLSGLPSICWAARFVRMQKQIRSRFAPSFWPCLWFMDIRRGVFGQMGFWRLDGWVLGCLDFGNFISMDFWHAQTHELLKYWFWLYWWRFDR